MNRKYRIALIIEGQFARKVKAKQEAERLLRSLSVRAPWAKTGTRISSRQIREPKMPEAKAPDPENAEREGIMARVLEAVRQVRAATPTLPRVSVRWVDRDGCGHPSRGNWVTAHAHRGKWWTRRKSGKRVSLPRNLICLHFARLKRNLAKKGASFDGYLAWLMAHEIAHMAGKRSHRSKRFGAMVRDAENHWKASVALVPVCVANEAKQEIEAAVRKAESEGSNPPGGMSPTMGR